MRDYKYSFKNILPKVANDLVRVGNKETDGGYVISKRQVEHTKVLIGLGVNYDWSFEENFKSLKKDAQVYCYDFSVGPKVYFKSIISSLINVVSLSSYTKEIFNNRSPLTVFKKPIDNIGTYFGFNSFFKPEKGNYFFAKGISDVATPIFITVKEMFENVASFDSLPENSVYVKMDIEGSEYDILEDLLKYRSKINGFVIEFHDLKHMWGDFSVLIGKLKEDYEVIHIHGNNACGYIAGTDVPELIELSVIKRSLLTAEELATANSFKYPRPELDRPNFTNKPDLKLTFS